MDPTVRLYRKVQLYFVGGSYATVWNESHAAAMLTDDKIVLIRARTVN